MVLVTGEVEGVTDFKKVRALYPVQLYRHGSLVNVCAPHSSLLVETQEERRHIMPTKRGRSSKVSSLERLGVLVLFLPVITLSLAGVLFHELSSARAQTGAVRHLQVVPAGGKAQGVLHVQGSQLIDGQGHPLLLRGAQIAGPLNYLANWKAGQDPTVLLNPMTFGVIRSWNMNALRLPVSGWYYQDPRFLPLLDTIITQANQAGLYVILALFDDAKSGSPYGQGAAVPKAENVTFWKVMAAHFAGNPMLLFDLFNEPMGLTAQTYLTGGGMFTGSTGEVTTSIGFQPLVDAIRSAGAQQIVIASAAIPAGDPSIRIHDANVMYTQHIYSGIAANNPAVWDQQWGSLLGQAPLFYGEWTVLPNSQIPQQCSPYTPANAAPLTQAFLSYMDERQINWTAWQFRPYALVQDMTSYTPTTFQGTWTPCDITGHEGMGEVVKAYLLQGS